MAYAEESCDQFLLGDFVGVNRRCDERKPYQAVVRVAPGSNIGARPLSDFIEVECRNISPTGISFYSEIPFDSRHVTVLLDNAEVPIFVTAEVAYCDRWNGSAAQRYVVGCAFPGRRNR